MSQPKAPGLSYIPGTAREVETIKLKAAAQRVRVLTLEHTNATVAAGLENMEKYSSIHLACHAIQDEEEPLRSRFYFYDGSLDLARLIAKNLENGDCAFLSACQTGAGDTKLSDEAVHLAAGMLAAGYRRVVATMWSIGDREAPNVAKDFYEYLLARQGSSSDLGFDGSLSAHALHHAIQQLRQRLDSSEKSFLSWVPYVHFGL